MAQGCSKRRGIILALEQVLGRSRTCPLVQTSTLNVASRKLCLSDQVAWPDFWLKRIFAVPFTPLVSIPGSFSLPNPHLEIGKTSMMPCPPGDTTSTWTSGEISRAQSGYPNPSDHWLFINFHRRDRASSENHIHGTHTPTLQQPQGTHP